MTAQESNVLYVMKRFIEAGATVQGAAQVVGQYDGESGVFPCRKQGDFDYPFQASELYARQLMTGVVSEATFCKGVSGWGLAQWTYPDRCRWLYDYCVRGGHYIGSLEAQMDFAIMEFKRDFAGIWADVCSEGADLGDLAHDLLYTYENPRDKSAAVENSRYQAGLRWQRFYEAHEDEPVEIADTGTEAQAVTGEATVPELPKDTANTPFWPPRILDLGMLGTDVRLLQDLLTCHGYLCTSDGIFGKATRLKVMGFQADNDLDPDGIAGPLTFEALGVVW